MKVLVELPTSMDGVVSKPPLIAGIVQRYRHITRSRTAEPEVEEVPVLSVRVEDRRSQLVQFWRLYEDFVESLCDGAQFGISPGLEDRYLSSRRKLIQNYSVLRPFVSAYLRPCHEDANSAAAAGIRFDAFDALLDSPSLAVFLSSDDGFTISRISRTREALNLYNEHLRQLVERTK